MCPLCIGTATLLASGATSAGGLTALLFRQRIRKHGGKLLEFSRKIDWLNSLHYSGPARLARRAIAMRAAR